MEDFEEDDFRMKEELAKKIEDEESSDEEEMDEDEVEYIYEESSDEEEEIEDEMDEELVGGNFLCYAASLKRDGEAFLKERNYCRAYECFKEALFTLNYVKNSPNTLRNEVELYVNIKLESHLNCSTCSLHKRATKCDFSDALNHASAALDFAQLEIQREQRILRDLQTKPCLDPNELESNRLTELKGYIQKAYLRRIQSFFLLKEHTLCKREIYRYDKAFPNSEFGRKRIDEMWEMMSGPHSGQKRGHDGSAKSACIEKKKLKEMLDTGAFGGSRVEKDHVSWIRTMQTNSRMTPALKKVNFGAKFLPGNSGNPNRIESYDKRAYSGQYSYDGRFFVSTCQDWSVRIYDATGKNFIKRKQAVAKYFNWTLTDACISKDSEMVVYSSITPVVHLFKLDLDDSTNGKCVFEKKQILLDFSTEQDEDQTWGIWSLRLSADKRQIIAGGSDNCLYLYDIERQAVEKFAGHKDEVNAVAFADDDVSNVLFTGSDDASIHMWDRRTMKSREGKPEGTLVGHTEGITFLSSKGDGVYLISNSKDQTMKLWDIRMAMSSPIFRKCQKPKRFYQWDYRIEEYPGNPYVDKHPSDQSVVTFVGHKVLQTLIRCHFSPKESTGQRYVYSGSADGTVRIYDLSGSTVRVLDTGDGQVVRDVSWHPHDPSLIATSWDGALYQF